VEDDQPISIPPSVAAAVAAAVHVGARVATPTEARENRATEAEEAVAAPARMRGAVLHLVAALFAKLRRVEQASL
jgi:hypothetical protein